MMDKSSGFSLLELMFAVAILALILVIGVPSFDSFIKKSHANNNVQNFAKTFVSARGQSVSLGDAITVCNLDASSRCQDAWGSGLTMFIDSNRDSELNADESILLVTEALNADDVLKTTSQRSVTFLPDGRLSAANNFTLKFCPTSATSEYSRGFIMSLTGRIRHSSDDNGDGRHQLDGVNVDCS